MERVSDEYSKSMSPTRNSVLEKGVEVTISKDMPLCFTTGNFGAVHFSLEAMEKAKKILDSPGPSPPKTNPYQFRTGVNGNCDISAEALARAQKLFDSPNQVSQREDKEKQTEEIPEKRPIRKNMPIGVRAGIIRHNRGELSCNKSITPKFVSLGNSKSTISIEKRRMDSPPLSAKSLPRHASSGVSNVSLLELNGNRPLKGYFYSCGVLVTADNAGEFVFTCNCYSGGCSCSRTGMCWEDFYDALIYEGCKCSKDWVQRHYRLVVWKYASYERRVQACKGIFTVSKVLENLRKRYTVEINEGRRSVLQRIVEGDEVASKRMVLCVASIRNYGSHYSFELVDGWNSCWVDVSDESLFFPLLQRKIISQGMKIEVVACSMSEGKMIIPFNSARRAAWDRKLGEVHGIYPFPIAISSVKEAGGVICRITGYISRIYPLLYMEGNTLKSKFTVTEPGMCFFECLVRDGVADYSSKKSSSALIKIKTSASEIFENLKLGALVNFYFLTPSKAKNFKRVFIFNHKSKITYSKKERKDLVKVRKTVDSKCKGMKEVDAVGIVISVQRTQSNEVCSLNIAGVHGNIKIIVHNPSLFGRVINIIEASTLKYMKIVAFLNVIVENKKPNTMEVRTSNYSEIIHSNFPSHLMQHIALLKEYNLNSLLSHRQECDHFGCVCGLE